MTKFSRKPTAIEADIGVRRAAAAQRPVASRSGAAFRAPTDDGMTRVVPTTRSADKGGPTLAAAVESFKADK